MERRVFITAASFLMAPHIANAQPARKQSRVGLLTLDAGMAGTAAPTLQALAQGLRDLGYVEGQSLKIEYRFAERKRDTLLLFAREMAALNLDVIVTFGTPATVAMRDLGTTVPIAFIGVGDPIGSGFAESLAHPGGNLTGFSFVGTELAPKNLELLKQAVPHASRVAVLGAGDPTQPLARNVRAAMERSAQLLGITLQTLQVEATLEQLESALAMLAVKRPDALLTLNDSLFLPSSPADLGLRDSPSVADDVPEPGVRTGGWADGLCAEHRRPAPTRRRLYRQDPQRRQARGSSRGTANEFEFVINLKTARTIGLTIPPALLSRADEIIQ